MSNGLVSFLSIAISIGFIALYIYFIILIVRACNAAIETRDLVKNMAFRDTARYLSEARRGIITTEDQDAAEVDFK